MRSIVSNVERDRCGALYNHGCVMGDTCERVCQHPGDHGPAILDALGTFIPIGREDDCGGDSSLLVLTQQAEIERLRPVVEAAMRLYAHRETSDRPLIDTLGDWLEARDALYAAVAAMEEDRK